MEFTISISKYEPESCHRLFPSLLLLPTNYHWGRWKQLQGACEGKVRKEERVTNGAKIWENSYLFLKDGQTELKTKHILFITKKLLLELKLEFRSYYSLILIRLLKAEWKIRQEEHNWCKRPLPFSPSFSADHFRSGEKRQGAVIFQFLPVKTDCSIISTLSSQNTVHKAREVAKRGKGYLKQSLDGNTTWIRVYFIIFSYLCFCENKDLRLTTAFSPSCPALLAATGCL